MEGSIAKEAFLKSPKFLRKLISPSAADLYALLREKRNHLVSSKLICGNDSWFFYRTDDLKQDLVYPTAASSIKKLCDQLEKLGLVKTRIQISPETLKEYQISDSRFVQLEGENRAIWKRNAMKKTKKYKQQDMESPKFQN